MNPAPSQEDSLKTSPQQTEASKIDHEASQIPSKPDIVLTPLTQPAEANSLNPFDSTSLERFYGACVQKAHVQLFVSSAVILVLVKLQINFFVILIVLWGASFHLRHALKSHKEDFAYVFEREKTKALLVDPSNPNQGEESVEWINSALASLWPLISPDIFRPVIDLLEDTLKVLAPGIVTTVRVDELDQGRNPIRLVAFKTLDAEDPWVKNQVKVSDLPGEFINLEVEFAYRRKQDSTEPASSAHFVAYFGIGVQKIASCEMPVFVQIDGLHGKIKLRIQLIAVPPFVQMTTFSFSYLPQVEITAKPMHGFNVMSLPVISHFIRASVDVLLGQFCLPSSYTLDLSRILLGNDALMRPRHVGVIAIALHSASNLKVSDILNHTSDPYVSISFMKSASKPLFSTLIHFRTVDPIFEEMAFVLITPDQLLEQEKICLTVCHSDRISSDDVLGKVEVDLQTAVKNPGSMTKQNSELTARLPGFNVQGSLSWSVGYFEYHKDSIPKEVPTVTSDQGALLNALDAESSADESELVTSPNQPKSGVISIQIHSLAQIEIRNPRHFRAHNQLKHHSRKLESDERNLPSTYCFVLINDQRIFETRVKKQTSDPYINSGVEHFVEDFDRTRVDLVVMEVRAREHDSIVGIVSVSLNKFLRQQHQLTKWWTLTGGNGSGKMRASVLFQPVDIKLERPLCGWSIGVIEIFKISIMGPLLESENFYVKITIDSQSNQCSKPTDEASVTRQGQLPEVQWIFKPRMKLPVTNRMQTTLTLQLMKPSTGKLALRDHAVSRPIHVWLSDVLHDDMVCLDVEISKTNDTITDKLISSPRVHSDQQQRREVELPQAFSKLSKDPDSLLGSMSKQTLSTEIDGDFRSMKSPALPSIPQQLQEHEQDTQKKLDHIIMNGSQSSRMHIAFRFIPGISKAHRALGSSDPGLMEVYQTCQRTISSGDRMRHPIIVDMYDVEPFNDVPVTLEVPQLSDDSSIADMNSSISESPRIGPVTPNLTNGKDASSTHGSTNDLLRDHRLKILDVEEAAENWTDDETSSSEDHDGETSSETSGISPKLMRMKIKTLELKASLLPKTLANKLSPNRDPSATDVILRRRKELKGESKEVYGLGPSKLKAVRTVKWARDSAKVGIQRVKDTASHRTPKRGLQKEAISSF